MRMLRIAAASAGAVLLWTVCQAQESAVERGRAFAEGNCARCHAIGPAGESPSAKAPEFRLLHRRYPVEDLTEALAEGFRTGHPAMPQFELEPDQIQDLLAYLKSLER